MKRILIIEDDENLSRGIGFSFESDGHLVVTANTLKDGEFAFDKGGIDCIILDIGLPDGSGLDLCKYIRQKSEVPIIMLTACDLETDEVQGLKSGADDYITKPFSLSVLKARVEALFRRLGKVKSNVLEISKYRLDTSLCKFFISGTEIPISATEFRLLHYLMSNAGQILSKEQILASLWDNEGNFVDENTLSVNISRLRGKLETDPKAPKAIKTIHGMGYVWVKE